MSRPRKRGEDRIALFPFLSVLICTIGVLTLILVSSVIGQVDEATTSSASLDNKYQEIRQKLREEKKNSEGQAQRQQQLNAAVFDYFKKLKELKETLEKYGEVSTPEGILKYKNLTNQVGQLKKTINEVKSEIVVLDEKLEKEDANGTIRAQKPNKGAKEIEGLRSDFIAVEGENEDLLIRINDKKQDLAEMDKILAELEKQKKPLTGVLPATEKDLEELAERIERIEMAIVDTEKQAMGVKAEVAKKEAELKEKTKGKGVAMGFAGKTKGGKTPLYVECSANWRITIHSKDDGKQKMQILNLDDRDKFRTFVKDLGFREIIIFLIRPSGIKTYQEANGICIKSGEKAGYIPLPDNAVEVRVD